MIFFKNVAGGEKNVAGAPGWFSQLSVQLLTLISSGHDLTEQEFDPWIWLYDDSVESAWDSISAPLLARALSQNK